MNCLNYSVPIRVAREYDGRIWYGTNAGLYCYDLTSKKTTHYTTGDGLPSTASAPLSATVMVICGSLPTTASPSSTPRRGRR